MVEATGQAQSRLHRTPWTGILINARLRTMDIGTAFSQGVFLNSLDRLLLLIIAKPEISRCGIY
jgi:hypothetical protein